MRASHRLFRAGPSDIMSENRIRAVLFDFGGVLAEEGFRDGLAALARSQGLDPERLPAAGLQAVYDSGFVLGHGSAADFWALLRQRCGLRGDDAELSARIVGGFVPRPAMIELVRKLRSAGYVTAILSDQTHWLDELDDCYHFMDAFDRVYNSYHLGKGKRDPTLFADVAADLHLPPPTLLFVDDDPHNVNRAREAGYQAMLFADERTCIGELQRLLD
jgi:putative hydrolase of the HAD superfamily